MIVAFLSAGGAPGVTTAAVATATLNTEPTYLVEADTSKTSEIITGFLGARYESTRGLSQCLAASHRSTLSPELIVQEQTLPLSENAWLVPGFNSIKAGQKVEKIWQDLSFMLPAIARTGPDVLIDFGRWSAYDLRMPLLEQADIILIMLRTRRPEIVTALEHLEYLHPALAAIGRAERLAAVTVGTQEQHYDARETAAALQLPIIASLPYQRETAEVYSLGTAPRRKVETQPYPRAIQAMTSAVRDLNRRVRADLGLEPTA